jgi:hypothetical protein
VTEKNIITSDIDGNLENNLRGIEEPKLLKR